MNIRIPLCAALFALALCRAALATPAPATPLGPETRDYDQIHLALDLRLDMDAGRLEGRATHRIASLAEKLSNVRMHAVEMEIKTVSAGTQSAKFTHADGILQIELPEPLERGSELTLTIDYSALPQRGLYFFKPSESHPTIPYQVWSQGEGTDNRHWIPCYDLPDDRLSSELRVTVPSRFTTLSNGTLVGSSEAEGGRSTHTWVQEREHVTYLITLVVGEFARSTSVGAGVEIHNLVPPGWEKHDAEIFGRTPAMMEFLVEATGHEYPWPRYSQVTVWDFMYGGMENTGATTLNMRALHGDGIRPDYSADGLIAHELVHMWYGDLITCHTFNHIWLNEGFATYFTDLWFLKDEGHDSFLMRRLESRRDYMNRIDLDKVAQETGGVRADFCRDIAQHQYTKGSSVLHMLRDLLGAETFARGIAEYTRVAADRSVTSEELRRAFERICGQDLTWFFEQWVYGSGFPRLAIRHHFMARKDGEGQGGTLVVSAAQTQPRGAGLGLFRLPATLTIYGSSGESVTRRVEIWRERQEWRVDLEWRPAFVRFDPEGALIADLQVQATLQEWSAQLERDPSPIGRLLAAEALAGHGEDAVAALSAAALGDARFEVRRAAVDALAKIESSSSTAALCSVTQDPDSRVRSAAYVALATRPARETLSVLADAIVLEERDYPLADAAFALAASKGEGVFELVTPLLARESHRNVVRHRLIDGLKQLGDPRAVDLLLPLLDYRHGLGEAHRMRNACLDTLVALAPRDERVRTAVAALAGDPYFRMRGWAIDAIVKLELKDQIDALSAQAIADSNPGIREAARRAVESLQRQAKVSESTPEQTETQPAIAVPDEIEIAKQEAARLEAQLRVLQARTKLLEEERELKRLMELPLQEQK